MDIQTSSQTIKTRVGDTYMTKNNNPIGRDKYIKYIYFLLHKRQILLSWFSLFLVALIERKTNIYPVLSINTGRPIELHYKSKIFVILFSSFIRLHLLNRNSIFWNYCVTDMQNDTSSVSNARRKCWPLQKFVTGISKQICEMLEEIHLRCRKQTKHLIL